MRALTKLIAAFFVLAVSVLAACTSSSSSSSSSSSGGSSGGADGGGGDATGGIDIFCTVPARDAGALSTPKGCFVFHHVTPGVDETPACSSENGTLTSACPTAGLFGCCTLPNGRTEQCYYDETDAGAEIATGACAALKGTWTSTIQ